MMKAKTALTLGKTYRQDQALDWGFLTEPEVSHLARRKQQARHSARARAGPSGAGTRQPAADATTRSEDRA